jgi:hypothetical protein
MVAVNVGGAVVPVAFSLYLITHNPLNPLQIATAVAVVAIIARTDSLSKSPCHCATASTGDTWPIWCCIQGLIS